MRRYAIHRALIVLLIMAGFDMASVAFAQGTAAGGFVTGPLTWTPTFQLHEAGVDSNVYNTPSNPKEDVVAGALSQVSAMLNPGIFELATQGSVEYVYFQRYSQERGFNRRVSSRLTFPVTRFSPDVTVTWNHVKDRGGNEIDTRTPRTDFGYAAGIQTKVTPRLSVTATAGKQRTTYESGFTFHDIEIARQLNRESILGTVTMRMTLTPLTTLVLDGTVNRDDFPLRPLAATDNGRVGARLEFAPDAIVRGSASIGYHQMQPHRKGTADSTAAAFTGVTSTVDLAYTLLSVTRVSGHFGRDSTYSLNINQPYYLSTAGALEILQTLFGPVDLSVRGSREKLRYPRTDLEAAYVDEVDILAGGLSIRAAPQAVIALIYDNSERRSERGREFGYQRRRIFTTVTYGF